MTPTSPPVKAAVFRAVLEIDIDYLLSLDPDDLIPVLPHLVRLALNSTTKQTRQDECFLARRKKLMKLLHPIDRANSIVPLLTIDFQKLDSDARLEQQTRHSIKHLRQQANSTIVGPNASSLSAMRSILLPKINVIDSNELTTEFERSEGLGRLCVILAEYMNICDHLRQIKENPPSSNTNNSSTTAPINRAHGSQSHAQQESRSTNEQQFKSELFDNPIYYTDVALCLSVLLAELPPTTLNILDMSETLLYVKNGPSLIARLVANMPDMFHEVCISMINNGDKQDEDTLSELKDQRTATLRLLCEMNPIQALTIRSEAIQATRLPSLTVMITLDGFVQAVSKFKGSGQAHQAKTIHFAVKREKKEDIDSDIAKQQKQLDESFDSVIAFVSGTLLGADDKTRSWFSHYIKLAQKRIDQSHPTVLSPLRSQLLWYMQDILLPFMSNLDLEDECDKEQRKSNRSSLINSQIIRASATLRMYCALRCIGMIKLNEQETSTLIRLITCKPTVSHTSVHFATIGFCTILACSSILSNQDAEKRATDWLKWLINKSKYTDTIYSSQGKSSLAELVLLVAIHFHSNQMGQIADLICDTLGMKIQIKTSITKCKSLFVQDVFTDQMVTEHSVKVPVTKNLNNNIPGFLPVHCIHQLLESRAFSKHQVPIKNWIFKQICQSTSPLHSILPQLIGAYVNSVIVTTSTHGPGGTNEPITCQEMEPIFKIKVYSSEDQNNNNFNTCSTTFITPSNKQSPKPASARTTTSKVIKSKLKRDITATNSNNELPITCTAKRIKVESDTQDNIHKNNIAAVSHTTSKKDDDARSNPVEVSCVLTSQILLLYYLLLYEDVRLKKNPENVQAGRGKIMKYKQEFMADIPIFYLLQQVHDNQHKYGSILAHLLKLVTTHFPQLCLVQHWLTSDKCSPPSMGIDNLIIAKLGRMSTIGDANENGHQKVLCIKGSSGSPLRGTTSNSKQFLNIDELKAKLEESFSSPAVDQTRLIKAINQILALPVDNLWPLSSTFVSNMSKLLFDDVSSSQLCLKVSSELWWRLNLIFPRKLWVMTVNILQVSSKNKHNTRHQPLIDRAACKPKEYDWNDIVNDPLCVLRCDTKVFRTAPILEIVLHMLSAFLAASRRHLHDHLREQPSEQNEEQRNREELRVALVAAQESAALQILLECCLPKTEQEEIIYDQLFTCINNNRSSASLKQANSGRVETQSNDQHGQKPDYKATTTRSRKNENVLTKMEIDGEEENQEQHLTGVSSAKTNNSINLTAHKCYKDSVIIICNHLHQVFISDTNLARLVHFQTYSGDLLPITTTYIPSMHICLDFVPDMMSQPDLKKQVFVIELVSHLCEKYAITKSLNAAKLCFNVSFTLLQLLPSRRRAIYFIPVLPALIRMSKIFPILKEDLDIILTQLNQITMAHLASTSSRLSLGSSTTPFEGLKEMTWRDTKKLMSTMDLQEALYLTIQSCIIELDRIQSREEL